MGMAVNIKKNKNKVEQIVALRIRKNRFFGGEWTQEKKIKSKNQMNGEK